MYTVLYGNSILNTEQGNATRDAVLTQAAARHRIKSATTLAVPAKRRAGIELPRKKERKREQSQRVWHVHVAALAE